MSDEIPQPDPRTQAMYEAVAKGPCDCGWYGILARGESGGPVFDIVCGFCNQSPAMQREIIAGLGFADVWSGR